MVKTVLLIISTIIGIGLLAVVSILGAYIGIFIGAIALPLMIISGGGDGKIPSKIIDSIKDKI